MNVLRANHDGSSHLGVWKVVWMIKQSYYWPVMYESTYKYIRNCSQCKIIKASNTPVGSYVSRTAWKIDIDKYIFVVIDCFTKFVWVKTMPPRLRLINSLGIYIRICIRFVVRQLLQIQYLSLSWNVRLFYWVREHAHGWDRVCKFAITFISSMR